MGSYTLHFLGLNSQGFAPTDDSNEMAVLWPWFSQAATSQFGCDVGKLSWMSGGVWPLDILG